MRFLERMRAAFSTILLLVFITSLPAQNETVIGKISYCPAAAAITKTAVSVITQSGMSAPQSAAAVLAVVEAAVGAAPAEAASIVSACVAIAPAYAKVIVFAAVTAAPSQAIAIVTAAIATAPGLGVAIAEAAMMAAPSQALAIGRAAAAADPAMAAQIMADAGQVASGGSVNGVLDNATDSGTTQNPTTIEPGSSPTSVFTPPPVSPHF
jgi:hypothetical protein